MIAPRRQRRWLRGVLLLLVGLVLGVAFMNGLSSTDREPLVSASVEDRHDEVVKSIELDEEVTLVSLGIQGIAERRIDSTFLGAKVPGTGKTVFLEYQYKGKLGIDASQVRIQRVGDNRYRITVPEFEFLGHSEPEFRVAVEDNGVISFVTPDVDTTDMVNKILNDEVRQQHINDNRAQLESQTKAFYSGIINAVDPSVELEFRFAAPK